MMTDPANDNAAPSVTTTKIATPGCPICGKPARADSRPFCGPRCADVDLHRWLGEAYVASGPDGDDGSDQV